MKLVIRWLVAALALFLAAWIVPGIEVAPNAWWIYAVVAVILGLVFLIVGVVLTITVVGAIVGVPFIIFGLLLMVRGLF